MTKKMALLFGGFGAYALSMAAFVSAAAASDSGQSIAPIAVKFPEDQLWSLLGGLAIIIAMIFVFGYAGRLFNFYGARSRDFMKVVGHIPIGSKERAVLLQVGEKQLLIGVAPGYIRTLHVMDENVVTEKSAEIKSDFSSMLRKVAGREE